MTAVTDPERRYRNDPGHPEICNIFTLHRYFNPQELDVIELRCRKGVIGCVACKELLSKGINTALEPFRQKRSELAGRPDYVRDVLADGARRAQMIARETLGEVKQKMGLL
jgi:tryptophanyl-tRNA synthetase